MAILIMANGDPPSAEVAAREAAAANLVIAADGGLLHCQNLGLEPDLVVGDLDSLPETTVAALIDNDVQVQRHPAEKEETDLELALVIASERAAEKIVVLGAFGGRWDQTLANLLLPASPRFRHLNVRLTDGTNTAWVVTPDRPVHFSGKAGDLVSLLPLERDAVGVTTEELAYPLQSETLGFGASRGVSNEMLTDHASVLISDGVLLCIHMKSTGQGQPE